MTTNEDEPPMAEKVERCVSPALAAKLARLGFLPEDADEASEEIIYYFRKSIGKYEIVCSGAYDLGTRGSASRWMVEVENMPAILNGRLHDDVGGECIIAKGNEEKCTAHLEEWDSKAQFAINSLGKPLTATEKLVTKFPKPTSPLPKVGRNERCPCESGKKFKHCCGKS